MIYAPTYCPGSSCDPCVRPCVAHYVGKQSILGSTNVLYPMGASYAAVQAALGHKPVPCHPVAMEIFCPGGGAFQPDAVFPPGGGIVGVPDPPSLPGSVSFTIGPLSYSGAVINQDPTYTFFNGCAWHVTGEATLGSGALKAFGALFTADIITTSSDEAHWGIDWPDSIVWFTEPEPPPP